MIRAPPPRPQRVMTDRDFVGLRHFVGMRSLVSLDVRGTGVTGVGVAALQGEMPGLGITW